MLTYKELMDIVAAAVRRQMGLSDSAPDPQTILNRRYHLRLLCRAAGKEMAAEIGADFMDGFDKLLEAAVASAPSQRTKGDVRRGLRWWRERYAEVTGKSSRGVANQPIGSFATVLREHLVAGQMTHARAAEIVGVPASTLSSWLQGVIPQATVAPGLARLEEKLGMTRGALSERVRRKVPTAAPAPVSAYRERLKVLCRDRYRLQPRDAGVQLMNEWQGLLRYKTAKAPTLQRSRRAVWRLSPPSEARKGLGWHNAVGQQYCASAELEWRHVSSFIGFLRHKSGALGVTMPEGWQPTLALFAVPELVESYFAWMVQRADGILNNRIKTLANFLQCLTVQPTGWLLQQPAFANHLPADLRPADWSLACATVNRIATAYRGEAKGSSRDPFEPIRGLLALPEPFDPIVEAIRLLDQRAISAGLQSPTAARAKRDALLLTILLSVPLRHRNLAMLTYRQDGTGTLQRRPDGRWHIHIPAELTKNKKEIDAPLPESAVARLDEYVSLYRPRLLNGVQSDYAIVGSRPSQSPWWGVNARVYYLTKTYIPGCPGFHTHTWRHLVATRWLDRHPEDYVTVAHLLFDDLQTVIKTYSRPSPAKAIARANKDIDQLMSRQR